MRTSLDRQIAILTAKKNDLPDRPERVDDKKSSTKGEEVKFPQKDLTVNKISNYIAKSPILPNPTHNNGNKK
jgi:hypothetical protein